MDIQITRSAQYGLEWRVVLPERREPRRQQMNDAFFTLPDDLPGDEFPTQEAHVIPELRPRTHVERR